MMKPKGVAIAALAQYGVMPLTAFCLAKVGDCTASEKESHSIRTLENITLAEYVLYPFSPFR